MNQRVILLVGLGLFLIMGLAPPWVQVFQNERPAPYSTVARVEMGTQYHILFNPPKPTYERKNDGIVTANLWRIEYGRLGMQWIMVVAATLTGVLVLQSPRGQPKPTRDP